MTKSKIPPFDKLRVVSEVEPLTAGKLFILVILLSVGIPAFAESVDTAWMRRYNGPGNGNDRPHAMAVAHLFDQPENFIPVSYSYDFRASSSSIGGQTFDDLNGNRVKDAGEPTLSNWRIRLSQGGSQIDSALTDANGLYTFGSLSPGTYTVSEVLPPGWVQTYPSSPGPGEYAVELGDSQIVTGKDFGNHGPALPWLMSGNLTDCNPFDSNGRPWYDSLFDDTQWQLVSLPDFGWGCNNCDRFYRYSFSLPLDVDSAKLYFVSDDGLWIYVNGTVLGHWGGECQGGLGGLGCVNIPGCGEGYYVNVPAVNIGPLIQPGNNVIAAHVHDGSGGEYFYAKLTLYGGGLVGYWSFDEGSGSIAHDNSGYGNNGTIYEATWATGGISGCALHFDGSNDYVDCGNDASLQITGNMTVVAWIKIGQQGRLNPIAIKGTDASPAGNGWYLWVREDNNRVAIQDNGPGAHDFRVGTTVIQPGVWYHVVGIFYADGSSRNKIYLNAVEEAISDQSGEALTIREDSGTPALIGYYGFPTVPPPGYFNGIIDEVRIYDRALSEAGIESLYNAAHLMDWTILVYMNGDNSLESAAIGDINEMEMVGSSDTVNIIVQVDRIPGGDATNGDWTDTRRYYIVNDADPNVINSIRLDTLPALGELNMGNPQTLADFVNWGINNYSPANHYAVVVWDHGSGWYKKPLGGGLYQDDILLKGMSFDDTDGDNIGVSDGDWESAISQIKNHLGMKVDLVGFDACLMQMWEVMDITDEYADYTVGSEETENWDGWNYTQFLSALITDPTMSPEELGNEIVDAAVDGDNEDTQSSIDLAQVPLLTEAVDDFASELLTAIEDTANDTIVRNIRSQLHTLQHEFAYDTHIDLYDFASYVNNDTRLPASLRDAANDVMTAVNTAVTWNRTQPAYDWAKGIAVYYPSDPAFYDNRYNDLPIASNTLWDDFVGFRPGVDLAVDMWGAPRARPGFSKRYSVRYINRRSDNADNVVLTITLPSAVQYSACDPPDCNVNGQNISWNLGTVAGHVPSWVSVDFYIPPEIPVGTVLSGEAEIATTSPDGNDRNNEAEENEMVVASMDPNDKEAQPWGSGLAHYILPDQSIRYTIFFENDTGATAEAIYIDIVDTLDANLDWSTLEIGPMSHPDTCHASFNPVTGVLTWYCDSIMLPPNHNPPEGEGFVGFSIKPDQGLPFGTQIKNRAYIKFDFNPWIAAPDSGPVIRTIGFRGDVNADGVINAADVVYLINYLYIGGPAPVPLQAGDVNCDGTINAADVVYLINYLYIGGPPPGC